MTAAQSQGGSIVSVAAGDSNSKCGHWEQNMHSSLGGDQWARRGGKGEGRGM